MFDLFIGNFGRRNAIQNGQSQKAIQVYRLLVGSFESNPRQVDTGDYWDYAVSLAVAVMTGKSVALCVGPKGIRLAGVVATLLRPFAFRRSTISVFVVGGWLPSLAARSPMVANLCRMSRVLVETRGMCDELAAFDITAEQFPNFRDLPIVDRITNAFDANRVRLIYSGRLSEAKGAVRAIELQQKLRARGSVATIDFYGSIEDAGIGELIESTEGADYKGKFDDVAETTRIYSDYDFLVLPSAYPGECVPGAVVEAMFAGLPSMVSDWRFLPELILETGAGMVFPLATFADDAATAVMSISQTDYAKLQHACSRAAERFYSVDVAAAILRRRNTQ